MPTMCHVVCFMQDMAKNRSWSQHWSTSQEDKEWNVICELEVSRGCICSTGEGKRKRRHGIGLRKNRGNRNRSQVRGPVSSWLWLWTCMPVPGNSRFGGLTDMSPYSWKLIIFTKTRITLPGLYLLINFCSSVSLQVWFLYISHFVSAKPRGISELLPLGGHFRNWKIIRKANTD